NRYALLDQPRARRVPPPERLDAVRVAAVRPAVALLAGVVTRRGARAGVAAAGRAATALGPSCGAASAGLAVLVAGAGTAVVRARGALIGAAGGVAVDAGAGWRERSCCFSRASMSASIERSYLRSASAARWTALAEF